jgi:hypothetical protein
MTSKLFQILRATAFTAFLMLGTGWQSPAAARTPDHGYATLPRQQQQLVSDLERRTFDWFWQSADPKTGLVPDSYPGQSFS